MRSSTGTRDSVPRLLLTHGWGGVLAANPLGPGWAPMASTRKIPFHWSSGWRFPPMIASLLCASIWYKPWTLVADKSGRLIDEPWQRSLSLPHYPRCVLAFLVKKTECILAVSLNQDFQTKPRAFTGTRWRRMRSGVLRLAWSLPVACM